MYYRHDLPYVYPDRSDEHMITVKKQKETNFDENFPYLPRGAKKAFLRSSFFLAFNLLAFPVCYVRYGLRYFGKENVRKYKKELKGGRHHRIQSRFYVGLSLRHWRHSSPFALFPRLEDQF